MSESRRQFLRQVGTATALAVFSSSLLRCARPKKQPNILFIAVDDLRPELGCYGQDHIVSPNIDRLAKSGIRFVNSHCNVPVCGASRASLLTGVRPTPQRFVGYSTWADKDLPGHLSLPRYLKENGYYTISNGKIYHHSQDDLDAWSETPWDPKGNWIGWQAWISEESENQMAPNPRPGQPDRVKGPAWEMPDCDDSDYPDGKIADKTLADLEKLAQQNQPFFLAAGFLKPHLPFNAPKKYWDLYDHDKIELADNPFPPKNAPEESLHKFGELRNGYTNVPQEIPLPDHYARWLVHGYQACVSYTDAQIGKLLNKLKELKLDDNTIVILWGDHGWNLGEHTLWCKHCNYETSLSAPIIIHAPWIKGNKASEALVEFVDIYPSLTELCGLPVPEHCEGISFVPLMKNPDQAWKQATFSRYFKGNTITTKRFQYTEFRDMKTDELTSRMLYDHDKDPAENINVVDDPQYQEDVMRLSGMMKKGWKAFKR